MHYFIDGYNLMFRVLRAGDDLQMQRESIIRDLNRKIQVVGLDVTIVFDAQYQKGESSRSHVQHLEILFTAQGETADECILHMLKRVKNPREQTVVTSDKKLAWLARRRGAHTETVEDFLKILNKRYQNKLKRPQVPLVQETIIPSPPKKTIPILTQKALPEECFEYYLEKFESNFQEIPQSQPAKKSEQPQKKKSQKPKKANPEKGLSDRDRWMKAFERSLSDDEAN